MNVSEMMKYWPWVLGATVAAVALGAAAGYFDPALAEGRRLVGFWLIVTGVVVAARAMRRVADDWPRAKPQHSLDAAFGQIVLAMFVICAALLISSRLDAVIDPFNQPLPKLSELRGWAGGFLP